MHLELALVSFVYTVSVESAFRIIIHILYLSLFMHPRYCILKLDSDVMHIAKNKQH